MTTDIAETHTPNLKPPAIRRPFFPYPGSKWKQMPLILSLLPHHTHYVSVFGGSATDIIAKEPSTTETFNDLDATIYNLFAVLRSETKASELVRLVEATPERCKRAFEDALQLLKGAGSDVEQAWAFIVVAHQGFVTNSPSLQTSSNWRYAKGRKAWSRWPNAIYMNQIIRRFKKVQLSSWTWQECIEKLDTPETCYFFDPPYLPSTIKGRIYAHEMSVEEHSEMLDALNNIEGYALLCGYDSDLYESKVGHWRQVRVAARAHQNVGAVRGDRTEVMWMNYDECGYRI